MRTLCKVAVFTIVFVFALGLAMQSKAATAVNLNTAGSFGILAGSGITNVGTSVVNGDIGSFSTVSITGFPPGLVTLPGSNHAGDGVTQGAKTDLTNAYNAAAGQTAVTAATELGGTTKTPGVYDSLSGTFQITGVLTLDAEGDPNAVFIFKTATTLITAGASSVNLINGAKASNVFWQVGSSATLGGASDFKGTILALTDISLGDGADIYGRALARNGAVTLSGVSIITVPATLHIIKHVVGGVSLAPAFTIGVTGTNVSTSSFAGSETGVDVVLDPGAYTVNEGSVAGYTKSLGANCSGTIAGGETRTCTITNTYVAPPVTATIHIIKHVINDNTGTTLAPGFLIGVTGTNVSTSSFAGSEAGVDVTVDAGAYSVDEATVSGYVKSLSADCSGTIAGGETKNCTITNDDIVVPPVPTSTITVIKTVVGGTKTFVNFPLFVNGILVSSSIPQVFSAPASYTVTETADPNYSRSFGGACDSGGHFTLAPGDTKVCTILNTYVASAGGGGSSYTVPVPPIITVLKVPSPLALPGGSGSVTYTYTLRNIGTVPVTNITMVDDSCSSIAFNSGDTNSDSKLDVGETWIYKCSTTLSITHTNTVVATGWANGLSATDIANATVVVGAPIVPPLINVTKVPSPLTLPAKGGLVTYTNKVTNPGTVSLSNVRLTDDKCGPVNYISGDTNGDNKLDPSETWTYTCQSNLTSTIINTVEASGDANGLTARDFAIVTVVVAAGAAVVPALPNTGIPFAGNVPWNMIVLSGIITILVSASIIVALKKFIA